ncbi:hypothetical protein IFM89_025167 [Coptis chinensis]|uniref:Alpha 1,4-glycosyltransferase domain-containing protein n=1 Tax=Coptis chinensis TaxID=261450 RepID=A0A835LRF6_9MAGN|nr:hypothetical protein IFM89_025167 [Coptis chinensis]
MNGCHARISIPRVQLGLPELMLGVIPEFGGTQLLPRLIGLSKAVEMMLKAKVSDELVLSSTSKGLVHAFFAQHLTSKAGMKLVCSVLLLPYPFKTARDLGPVLYLNRYFAAPADETSTAQQYALLLKILDGSYTFHFWNGITSALVPEPVSLVAKLLNHHCIHCLDVL